jgi:hypothetical protein
MLTEQVRGSIEWANGVTWDVAWHAEVCEDAGTGRGWMVAGEMWSEVGRLRKVYWVGEGGLCAGWKATRGGVVTGGDERDGVVFAVGAGLQIWDGEKRDLVGTRQENVPGVVGEMVEGMKGMKGEVGDWGDGGSATGGCEGWVGDVKRQVRSFTVSYPAAVPRLEKIRAQ